jgi:hypothetical protein
MGMRRVPSRFINLNHLRGGVRMAKDWFISSDNTHVVFIFEEGEVTVPKEDFDRAFGTLVNMDYEQMKAEYGKKGTK